jgi:hypothetical protein
MIRVDVDPGNVLQRGFSDLERRNLPFAVRQAVNQTAFAVRQGWAELMPKVFDRPTALTLRAVLYRKATSERSGAEIYIRDEAFKGTPPAKYLQAQVEGGNRRLKSVEKRLQASGHMPAGMYAVPGKGAKLDAHGNIPGSQINQVLSQLGARFDPLQNETEKSRGRRQRRQARKGERAGDYFAVGTRLRGKGKGRQHLPLGVYQRISTGFGGALRSVLHFVRSVSYRPRYRIFDLARRIYDREFPFHFERELAKAVQSSKFRGRG